MKRCTKCDEFLSLDRYNTRKNGNLYSWCKTCTSNSSKERGQSDYNPSDQQRRRNARPFRTLCHQAKARQPKDFELTEEFLVELFVQQKEKCYWFGVPLTTVLGERAFDQVSVDRLDNSRGYQKDNVVLVCWFANLGRGNKTAKEFEEWVRLLKSHVVQNALRTEETRQEIT